MDKNGVNNIINSLYLVQTSKLDVLKSFSEKFGTDSLSKVENFYTFKKDLLNNSSPTAIHEIFYFLLLSNLLNKRLDEVRIQNKLIALEDNGIYTALPKPFLNRFPKLQNARNNPLVGEVYTNFYGYLSTLILNKKIRRNTLIRFIKSNMHRSGLVFNNEYSNTDLSYRFESEYTMNLMFVSVLNTYLDLGINLNDVLNWILDNYQNFKSLASLYFSLNCLRLQDNKLIKRIDNTRVEKFLKARIQNGGYFEYLLEDKRDEHMSSRSITKYDVNLPHVFSTYYGLGVEKILDLEILPKKDALSFLINSQNDDGGFGEPVLVKEFKNSLSKNSSLLETILMLISPSFL